MIDIEKQRISNPRVQHRIPEAVRLRRAGRSTDDPEFDEAIDGLIRAGLKATRIARRVIREECEELVA